MGSNPVEAMHLNFSGVSKRQLLKLSRKMRRIIVPFVHLTLTSNTYIFSFIQSRVQPHFERSRGCAMVRALASHQCGRGSIPGPGVVCGLSLLLVLSFVREVFLRVLRFSPLLKNQHCQIPIRSGMHGHMLNELLSVLKDVRAKIFQH